MVVQSLKSYLYYFSEAALFFGIRTDLLYRYCFPMLLVILSLDVLTFTMLSLVTCLISPSCHAITWPLTRRNDSYNYHDNRNDDLTSWLHLDIFWYISVQTVLLILLTCSCSFPKSNNYLISYKMGQLISGQGKLMDINICLYLQWY